MLRKYLATGRLSLLIQHLSADATLLAGHVDNVVAAIFGMGDELPSRSWDFVGTPEQNELADLARNCLEQIVDRNLRAQRLVSLVCSASGLSMPYHIIVPECDEDARTKRLPDEFLVDEPHVSTLRQTLIDTIDRLSETAVVLETTDSIGALLHVWSKWGDDTTAGKWLLAHRQNRSLTWGFLWVAASWDDRPPPHRGIPEDCVLVAT